MISVLFFCGINNLSCSSIKIFQSNVILSNDEIIKYDYKGKFILHHLFLKDDDIYRNKIHLNDWLRKYSLVALFSSSIPSD